MTRSASAALLAHLSGPVVTVCSLWTLTRTDGQVFRFTDHQKDIEFNGNLFEVAVSYTASEIQTEGNLTVPNLDIAGLIDDDRLQSVDVTAGVWDYADVLIELINYNDPSMGSMILRAGTLGEIKLGRKRFTAELRGIAQNYQQSVVQLYSALCRARFGDQKCGYPINYNVIAATVVSVVSRKEFVVDYSGSGTNYAYGLAQFTSGENNGIAMEVKSMVAGSPVDPSTVFLQLPMPYDINAGDTLTIKQGCNKTLEQCAAYGNTDNFRGEPFVPFADNVRKGSAK